MNIEREVLCIVSQRLEKAGILYMVTGSIAGNFYSVPRMTRDIDIVIEVKNEDAKSLLAAFEQDFYIDLESVQEAIQSRGMFNIIHKIYAFKIDFIIRKDSEYRKTEFERRKVIQSQGVPVSVVSLEDLILSKLFWAKDSFSEMQLRDVRNLFRAGKNIDQPYLDQWIPSLGLESVYQKVNQ